jgi:hypothetical protein
MKAEARRLGSRDSLGPVQTGANQGANRCKPLGGLGAAAGPGAAGAGPGPGGPGPQAAGRVRPRRRRAAGALVCDTGSRPARRDRRATRRQITRSTLPANAARPNGPGGFQAAPAPRGNSRRPAGQPRVPGRGSQPGPPGTPSAGRQGTGYAVIGAASARSPPQSPVCAVTAPAESAGPGPAASPGATPGPSAGAGPSGGGGPAGDAPGAVTPPQTRSCGGALTSDRCTHVPVGRSCRRRRRRRRRRRSV